MAYITKEYKIACFNCGSYKNIVILPHHKEDNIEEPVFGLIFVCKKCCPEIQGKNVIMDIKIEKAPSPKTKGYPKNAKC